MTRAFGYTTLSDLTAAVVDVLTDIAAAAPALSSLAASCVAGNADPSASVTIAHRDTAPADATLRVCMDQGIISIQKRVTRDCWDDVAIVIDDREADDLWDEVITDGVKALNTEENVCSPGLDDPWHEAIRRNAQPVVRRELAKTLPTIIRDTFGAAE